MYEPKVTRKWVVSYKKMSWKNQKLQENESLVVRKWVVRPKSYKKMRCTTQKLQENEVYDPKFTRKWVVQPKSYKKMRCTTKNLQENES